MFCPSKLQQRMNEWAPAKEKDGQKPDTKSADILESRKGRRFTGQYLLLTFFLSLPLVVAILIHGHPWGWLLLAVAPLTAYGTSLLCLPLGLHTPLLLGLVYLLQPQAYLIALNNVFISFSFCQSYPILQIVEGLATGTVALLIILLLSVWLLRGKRLVLAGSAILIGGTLSVCWGSWLATQSWFFTMAVSGLTGVSLLLVSLLLWLYQIIQKQIKFTVEDEVRSKLLESMSNVMGEAHSKLIESVSTAPDEVRSKLIESISDFLQEVRSKPIEFLADLGVWFFAVGVIAIVLSIVTLIVTLIGSSLAAYSVAVGMISGLMVSKAPIAILYERHVAVFLALFLSFRVMARTAFSAYREVLKLALTVLMLRVALRVGIKISGVLSEAEVVGWHKRKLVMPLVGWGVSNFVPILTAWSIKNFMAIIVGGGVAFVVAGMATLPLPIFLLSCWLVSFSLSPQQIGKPGIVIIITFYLLLQGFHSLGWGSLIVALVALSSYCRLIPDYLVLALLSRLVSLPLANRLYPSPSQRLSILPPYTTELLWLPLPNHDRILAAAFRQDSSAALVTFHQMQTLPLPGFQGTIKKALPQIVVDQLAAVHTIPELLATAKPEHPLLPLLVPLFYQQNIELEEQLNLNTVSPVTKAVNRLLLIGSVVLVASLITGTLLIVLDTFWAVLLGSTFSAILGEIMAENVLNDLSGQTEDGDDINRLLPRLQAVAQDVNAVLNVGSAALRDRGLERILNNLAMLQAQLPGLGLKVSAIKRWKPVIERWQQVIQQELEEQQKQSQGELLNPFQYGNPLKRDRTYLFKGRQAFADNIVRFILDRNRPTLVLHGPRRFGKSSFLLNLPRLLPSDMLPIYLDMQSAAVTTDEAAFCQGLVRAISKDSRSQGVELPAVPQRQEFLDTPYIALEDWLEQAVPKLGDRRLLFNLDEFEKIGSAINEGRMSLNLFDELRHLIQHYDQLGFLFSGVQTLDELGPNWSSYFISVVPIEMLYLEPHEAEDLLVNPDPEFTLRYDTGIVEQILTLTRCQPYLLQLIGSSLVTLANERHTQLVTSDLLQASIPEAFTNGQPYFTNVWTEFTGTSLSEVKAGQELLLALAQGNQPSSVASDETAQAARRRLLRYHVIEHINGSDRFEIPLIERWVRERAIRN
jgi:hypothetical protein